MPAHVVPYEQQGRPFIPVDLDGDGQDERVIVKELHDLSAGQRALDIKTHDGRTIEQVNYSWPIQRPEFVDVNEDGTLELLVPFVRADSLFFSFVDAEGRKRRQLFVTTGEPRTEPEGTIPWDPEVREVYYRDVNGDGSKELIAVVVTRYARLPRGVWVFEWPSGRLLGKKIVGAMISPRAFGDGDDDGRSELIFVASSSNNGAVAGGMDDRYTYLGAFEVTEDPRLQWTREMGGLWTYAELFVGDFEGDGKQEYLASRVTKNSRPSPASLHFIDPATGETERQFQLGEPLRGMEVVDLRGGAAKEILTLDERGQLSVFNGRFERVGRRLFGEKAQNVDVLPDADGDGRQEVIVTVEGGRLFVNSALQVKAFTEQRGAWTVMRRGAARPPYLYAERDGRAYLFRMEENPWYWFNRYGPWALGFLGAGTALGLGALGLRNYRRRQELEAERTAVMEGDASGQLLVTVEGDVEHINAAAQAMLGTTRSNGALHLEDLRGYAPELVKRIEDAMSAEPRRHQEIATLGASKMDPTVEVIAEPYSGHDGTISGWLVRLEDPAATRSPEEYRTWGLMARRVAHDLKNPLTSILLTLQRMQMEYREEVPEKAEDLDIYTERIEERIEHLRRMTTNLMKFVGAEEPNCVQVDLNDFVEEERRRLRPDLPPDIAMGLKLEDDVPPVQIDIEQMQSVIENLMANAVEALPEGGKITIATHLERGLQWTPDEPPADYARLEVQDTGTGMDAETQAQIFEPGFTTAEEGTGLGLAIVRKVITDHGGHVEVESEPGVGTVFSMYLPFDE